MSNKLFAFPALSALSIQILEKLNVLLVYLEPLLLKKASCSANYVKLELSLQPLANHHALLARKGEIATVLVSAFRFHSLVTTRQMLETYHLCNAPLGLC